MTKKLKKSTSNDGTIEVSLGEAYESKRYVMEVIAKKFSIYGATVWLNTPIRELEGKTPAEAMKENDFTLLLELVKKL